MLAVIGLRVSQTISVVTNDEIINTTARSSACVVIGASLSEPHTSGAFSYKISYVRRAVYSMFRKFNALQSNFAIPISRALTCTIT